jgi:DNA-directed RNA polymerase subunit RPC12/RpoP
MAFQFTCPSGHLLEADPMQVGQQCQCPHCGVMFAIPAPPGQMAPRAPMAQPGAPMAQPGGPAVGSAPQWPAPANPAAPPFAPAEPQAPGIYPTMPGDSAPTSPAGPAFPDVRDPSSGRRDVFGEPTGPQLLHIPCPKGHVLETPPEMVGEEVMCPHCNTRFKLHERESLEYKRKQKAAQEKADYISGKKWFAWAVIFAVIVLGGLAVMIIMGSW